MLSTKAFYILPVIALFAAGIKMFLDRRRQRTGRRRSPKSRKKK
jgi:hypothetical protein